MRRTDRLFELIQLLRDGRLHRGKDLAEKLGISVRTLYRDMETIIASGIPVEGERGLGYMMTAPITLPPLNLTLTELEALHLGLSVVSKAADEELQKAAETLSAKVDAVLPEDRSAPASGWGFAVYPFAEAARGFATRIMAASTNTEDRIHWAYRTVLARPADEKESAVVSDFFATQLAKYQKAPEEAAKAIRFGESPPPDGVNEPELAAWTLVANLILNLDEAIVRN